MSARAGLCGFWEGLRACGGGGGGRWAPGTAIREGDQPFIWTITFDELEVGSARTKETNETNETNARTNDYEKLNNY